MADILVVEDEDSLLQTLRYNLARAGHDVRLCTDGAQALDVIRGKPPDLVVLDLMLPRLGGLDVCRAIRGDAGRSAVRHVPILILTARDDSPVRLEFNDLVVDVAARRAMLAEQPLELKRREFDLLAYFAQHPGHVLTRDRLLRHVWGYEDAGDTRTVDVHVRWLRSKIERDPTTPERLQSVRGVGYVFVG